MRVRMQATLVGLCEFWKRRYFLKQVTNLPLHVLSSSQTFKASHLFRCCKIHEVLRLIHSGQFLHGYYEIPSYDPQNVCGNC